jgi:hypothetical protein
MSAREIDITIKIRVADNDTRSADEIGDDFLAAVLGDEEYESQSEMVLNELDYVGVVAAEHDLEVEAWDAQMAELRRYRPDFDSLDTAERDELMEQAGIGQDPRIRRSNERKARRYS